MPATPDASHGDVPPMAQSEHLDRAAPASSTATAASPSSPMQQPTATATPAGGSALAAVLGADALLTPATAEIDRFLATRLAVLPSPSLVGAVAKLPSVPSSQVAPPARPPPPPPPPRAMLPIVSPSPAPPRPRSPSVLSQPAPPPLQSPSRRSATAPSVEPARPSEGAVLPVPPAASPLAPAPVSPAQQQRPVPSVAHEAPLVWAPTMPAPPAVPLLLARAREEAAVRRARSASPPSRARSPASEVGEEKAMPRPTSPVGSATAGTRRPADLVCLPYSLGEGEMGQRGALDASPC